MSAASEGAKRGGAFNCFPAASHALSAVMQLNAPPLFAPSEAALIKLLVYEKNWSGLFNTAATDPARVVLSLQLERNNYDDAEASFNTIFQDALQNKMFSMGADTGEKNSVAAFIDDFLSFSVKTADAQATPLTVPVYDPLVHAAVLAGSTAQIHSGWLKYLENLALDIGLQLLKNTLMAQIQSHVLKWIQGSGAPRFVQNWGDDFANAAIMSATNYINSNFACIGSSVFPGIQIVMNAIYKPGNNACAAQFQSQLSQGNLTSFINNFSNGGFVTFAQTLLPSNNFYGGLFFTAQGVGQTAQQSQSLFSVKTTAQQGFKGTETCADGSNPNNGTHLGCLDSNNLLDPNAPASGTCPAGDTPTTIQNNGTCSNGLGPTTQSPGQMTAQMLDKSIGTAPQLIAGTNGAAPGVAAALINALAISLINSLASTLVTTASGAINGAINNLSTYSSSQLDAAASATPTSTSVTALTCSPANQSATIGTMVAVDAWGGTYDANANPPTYIWTSSPDNQTGAGDEFDVTYNTPNTYSITLTDSAGDPAALCLITVASNPTSTPATSTSP